VAAQEREEMKLDVARLKAVIRVFPPPDLDDLYPDHASYESWSVDEVERRIETYLMHNNWELGEALQDQLGPGFTVTFRVGHENSIEIVAVVSAAYAAIVKFNDVVAAIRQAAETLRSLLHRLLRPIAGSASFSVATRTEVASPLIGPGVETVGADTPAAAAGPVLLFHLLSTMKLWQVLLAYAMVVGLIFAPAAAIAIALAALSRW
jgi:hypothetical protein